MSDRGVPVPLLGEERERAVRRLGAHFAKDHLDVEDFERRVDRVYDAATLSEIEELFRDLPALHDAEVARRAGEVPLPARARPEDVPQRGLQVAVMSGVEKKGAWTPARNFTTIAVMGGAGLDLREARFGPGVTEIRVLAIMGGVEILVPPGLAVETHGLGFMGGFESVDLPGLDPDPNAPRVVIKGLAIMGGVEVAVRLPGETARDAKRRLKEQRRTPKLGRLKKD